MTPNRVGLFATPEQLKYINSEWELCSERQGPTVPLVPQISACKQKFYRFTVQFKKIYEKSIHLKYQCDMLSHPHQWIH